MSPHRCTLALFVVVALLPALARAQALSVYWTDWEEGRVHSAQLDGSQQQTIFETPILDPAQVTYDPVLGRVYFADPEKKAVLRCDPDGSNLETILTSPDVAEPRDVAVDPVAGKIYVSDTALGIVEASLDGQAASVLVVPAAEHALNGIAVDGVAGVIYFTNTHNSFVWEVNTDGTGMQAVAWTPMPRDVVLDPATSNLYVAGNEIWRVPVGGGNSFPLIAVFSTAIAHDPVNSKLYWAQPNQNEVGRADVDGQNQESLVSPAFSPKGVAVDPTGGQLFWTNYEHVVAADLDAAGPDNIASRARPYSLTVDSVNQILIWGDWGNDVIRTCELDGSLLQDLYPQADAGGLDVDDAAQQIYYGYPGLDRIRRIDADGTNMVPIIFSLPDPWDVVLDPENGDIYWVDRLSGLLQMRSLAGGTPITFLSGLNVPRGIDRDPNTGWVYFTNGSTVERFNPATGGRDVIATGMTISVGLTVDPDGGKVYWTNKGTSVDLYRANLDGTQPESIATASVSTSDFSHVDLLMAVTTATPVSALPMTLHENAPNPFNPRTTIRFDLAHPGPARLSIYDPRGRHVVDLLTGSRLAAGPHAVTWEGRDRAGREVASGIYTYRLVTGGQRVSRRMALIR